MKIVCAWCNKDMGEKDGRGVEGTSHAMCLECITKVREARIESMPYKLSSKGTRDWDNWTYGRDSKLYSLTDLMKRAMQYLSEHQKEGFIESSTIAHFYGLAPQAMRGPCASLHRQGLIDKEES